MDQPASWLRSHAHNQSMCRQLGKWLLPKISAPQYYLNHGRIAFRALFLGNLLSDSRSCRSAVRIAWRWIGSYKVPFCSDREFLMGLRIRNRKVWDCTLSVMVKFGVGLLSLRTLVWRLGWCYGHHFAMSQILSILSPLAQLFPKGFFCSWSCYPIMNSWKLVISPGFRTMLLKQREQKQLRLRILRLYFGQMGTPRKQN